MFKLLVVEDERATREAFLENVDWELWGFSDVRDARNGEEALDLCRDFRPDVIITDIRMPRMDGLQFAERVHALQSQCRVIILSAFQTPDYVQAAFRSKVFDYLLKPLREDRLQESLCRVVQDLIRTVDREPPNNDVPSTLPGSLNSIREQVIKSVLGRTERAGELWTAYRRLFRGEGKSDLSFALIYCRVSIGRTADGDAVDELENRLAEPSDRIHVADFAFAQSVRIDDRTFVFVLGATSPCDELECQFESLERDIRSVASALGLDVVQLFRAGWAVDLPEIAELFSVAAAGSEERNASLLGMTPATVHEKEIAKTIMDIITERFIDERLSVKVIAKTVSRTSAYICMAFKKAFGLTITDYLNLTRVREAKQLLDGTDLKLYDIAYEVGFTNESYFAKVFRKYENRTPTEYRERER